MSTDFSIRPVGVPAPSPVIAPPGPAANNGVATELPASQSVTPAEAGASLRNDPSAVSDEDVTHQAYFDRDAASMVFQVVSGLTNQVVEQFPDDGTLRRRAYFHALDLAKEDKPRSAQTDRSA